MKKPKVGIISLGCPRNLVDSELMLGKLLSAGYLIQDEMAGCDIAIINTCAFIEDAKREAIEVILKAVELKKQGLIKKLVVSGCLGQRYAKDLKKDIPEIDGILGVDNFKKVEEALLSVQKDKHFMQISSPEAIYTHKDPRLLLTPAHYAYVKIAEGCKNRCSYCAIYKIRGDFRSRPIESVVSEIKTLTSKKKFPELNLIAQDTTSYGVDKYGKFKLPLLLRKICKLKKATWIRLLYTHPKYFSDDLIEIIADHPSICRYIDLPIQHINDRILKRMNRKVTRKEIESLIAKIRSRIPDVALRTSIIVGFPGETEENFKELRDFIKEAKFERLGIFIFSREEGTPAYKFKNQCNEKLKKARFEALMGLQQDISREINAKFLGKELKVLVEEKDKSQKDVYIGRTEYDAPEVDGQVYIHSKKVFKPGQFAKVMITDTLEYDLVGRAE